jgi:nucleoside-diphosphate-sugar epimerase
MSGNNKKILITGATGYIGAKITLHLKNQGYNVIALCRTINEDIKQIYKGIEIIQGDLCDTNFYEEISQLEGIHTIIHTVSLDHHQTQQYPVHVVANTNVNPTWLLLDQFTQKGLKNFIYLSTVHVLGKLPSAIITEKALANPMNKYALTHFLSEKIVNYYNSATKTACINARLSNGYGTPVFHNNNCWWLVVNDLCKMAFYERKIVLQSEGTAQRDFLHISDVAYGMEVLIENKCQDNIVNLSSGVTYSLLEVAHLIQSVFYSKYNNLIPVFRNGTELSIDFSDSSKKFIIENNLLKSIGFNPKTTLSKGIEELFNYFEE